MKPRDLSVCLLGLGLRVHAGFWLGFICGCLVHAAMSGFLCRFWGSELKSSRLTNKHFPQLLSLLTIISFSFQTAPDASQVGIVEHGLEFLVFFSPLPNTGVTDVGYHVWLNVSEFK